MSLRLGGKGCIIAVILLLAGVSIVPDLGANRTFNNTIYVDDDNIGGPWDGTTENPYQRIQDGIGAASDDDTVYVYSGVYYEYHIRIKKSINLIGENKESTIVDVGGNYHAFSLEVDFITISGFTIQNGDRGLYVTGANNTISGNIIKNNEKSGIFIFFSSNNNISKNIISGNKERGIQIDQSDNNIINQNIINDTAYHGIIMGSSSSNSISGNKFINNSVGMDVAFSSNITITGNTFSQNEYDGIDLHHYTTLSIVSNNEFRNNGQYGLQLNSASGNIISCNNFIFNKRNTYFIDCSNTWNSNYWNRLRFLPKLIFGKGDSKLSIEVDWHPAKIPNKIVSNPFAIIETNMGTMKLELYKDKVPITVENFIKLANDGFYDDIVFHRVIDDFVIQGGGYYANGTHKTSPYGSIELEIHPDVCHVDGAISMARTSDPNSATSQFFICDGKQSFLDDDYAAFGKIIVGIDVLRDVASVETTTKYRMQDWPVDDVIIESVTILNQ